MTRLAWLSWIAIVGTFIGGVVLTGTADEDGPAAAAAYTTFVLAFATMGALIASRRPRNPIGWILLGAGLSYAVGGLSISAHENAAGGGGSTTVLEWVSTWVWMAGIGPAATFGLLLFPDGRLPSPRWRWLARMTALAIGLVLTGLALAPGRFDGTSVENPVGLTVAPALPDAMATTGGVLLALSVAGAIWSLSWRYRRARAVERQQLKVLTYTAALVGVALAAAIAIETFADKSVEDLTNSIVTLALAAVPVAMGVAILRHRLYDIDLVIKRTLVYGALTAFLVAAYLGSVLVFGLVLDPFTRQSDLAVAGSTLAVAALFRPLRRRIQSVVDRRFYRERYDAARTLVSFTGRLRQEVDLEALGTDLRRVAHETLAPTHVSLWLRSHR